MSRVERIFFLISLLVLVSGCAAPVLSPGDWQDNSLARFWPSPPDQARIKLVRVLSDVNSLGPREQGGKFFEWLTGGQDDEGAIVLPHAVAVDGFGRVWVTDAGLAGVHLLDLTRKKMTFWGGTESRPMLLPLGVAYDSVNSRVYVSDALASTVYAFDPEGNPITSWRPTKDFVRPVGMTVDSEGRLYVVDALPGTVEVFAPDGKHLVTLDSSGSEFGAMNRPVAVAVDSSGHVFVVDSLGFRVLVFTLEGTPVRSIAKLGDSPGSLARPRGVAVDSQGHVYVTDAAFDNIQIFDMAGNTLLFFGGAGSDPGFFSLPAGIAFDRNDLFYVVDAQNKRVQIFQFLSQ